MKLKTQNQSGCKFPFETLRKLYDISKEEEVPAYVIFSDAFSQMETTDQ
jgi:ATP-dependent DNA helicase RecQ